MPRKKFLAVVSLWRFFVVTSTCRICGEAAAFAAPTLPTERGTGDRFRDDTPTRGRFHRYERRRRVVSVIPLLQLRASTSTKQDDNEQKGSVLGASLLFAGTAIGAGMLALPAETAAAGYVPSVSALLLCWLFTFVTALVTLEAAWSVSSTRRHNNNNDEDGSAEQQEASSFLSMTRETLGPIGEVVTALLFWFLLTSIVVAYTAEGGTLLAEFGQEQGFNDSLLSPATGSCLFMAFFASFAFFGTSSVDLVNRVLVAGLVGTFVGLVGIGLPQIDTGLLVSHAEWKQLYPRVISIGILAFGAQNVVPTILQYLGGDAVRTQNAILAGSLIPLVMYCLWESVFLGLVPVDSISEENKMQVVTALSATTGGTTVKELVELFSACSIGSSMAGASVSLVDFFQDGIALTFETKEKVEGVDDVISPAAEPSSRFGGGASRLLAATLALGPPLGFAIAYPGAFLSVLENAGLIGGVSLYGILPALAVLRLRQESVLDDDQEEAAKHTAMPGRLLGGVPALYGILAVSLALLVPDLLQLSEGILAT